MPLVFAFVEMKHTMSDYCSVSETIWIMMVPLFHDNIASCDVMMHKYSERLDVYPMLYGTNEATLLHFLGWIK